MEPSAGPSPGDSRFAPGSGGINAGVAVWDPFDDRWGIALLPVNDPTDVVSIVWEAAKRPQHEGLQGRDVYPIKRI
jgi:hypothetical protein